MHLQFDTGRDADADEEEDYELTIGARGCGAVPQNGLCERDGRLQRVWCGRVTGDMYFVVNTGSDNSENCGSGCSADARTHDREYEETWRRLPIKVPMESLAELLAGKIASGQRNFGGSIFAAWRWLFGLVFFFINLDESE